MYYGIIRYACLEHLNIYTTVNSQYYIVRLKVLAPFAARQYSNIQIIIDTVHIRAHACENMRMHGARGIKMETFCT